MLEPQWPDILKTALDVQTEAMTPGNYTPTGIRRLDVLLDGGFRGGEVMVLAARPRVGKSAFALQVILDLLGRDVPVGLWTLEMSQRAWLRRALSQLSGIDLRAIRMGTVPDSQMDTLNRLIVAVGKLPLLFATSASTPAGFADEAREMVERRDAGLLVVDYVQLMEPPPDAYSRENEVAQISRAIKQTSLELDVPVLLLAQLNRDAEERPPTLGNLRESGALEQDADIVTLLHRERDKETRVLSSHTLCIVEKNRDGESGAFALRFDGGHMWFTEP